MRKRVNFNLRSSNDIKVDKEQKRTTESGTEIKVCYYPEDIAGLPREVPGAFPYTRGVQSDLYLGR